MPRPGPRPYECVRRAWHSDRHQPIRGSIIQQIFRYVNETHSTKTKKNREWQEKLPIVVLKAEEIMYSKANSEAEYMNLDTLWDRVNDAINTIIRREESAETGELLPPCVEAALTLGCIPIRASRSQRQSNPRSYLSPRTQGPGCVPPEVLDNSSLLRVHSAHQSISARPETVNSAHLASEPNRPGVPHTTSPATPLCKNFPSLASNNEESNIALNVGSVYPLYYGTDYQAEVCRLGFQEPRTSNTIILGRPVLPSVAEHTEVHCLPGLERCNADKNVPSRTSRPESGDNYKKEPNMECDLSLRLGLSSDSGSYAGKDPASGTENVGPIDFQAAGKSKSSPRNKEFSFFPVESANDPSGQHTSRMISEGEGQLGEASVRKRKVPFFNSMDNAQFFWQEEPISNHFAGQRKRPGL